MDLLNSGRAEGFCQDSGHGQNQYGSTLPTCMSLLATGDNQTCETVFRSFVERIEIADSEVTVSYRSPENKNAAPDEETAVLSLVPFGGAGGIRTLYLFNAIEALSQLSYSPV